MAAVKTLPTDVSKVGAEGNVKLFGRWEAHEVECKDISLTDYIQIRHAVYLPTLLALDDEGPHNGKKLMAVRIVAHAFEIIHLLTDQNPSREDSTRIGSQGTVRRQAVDVSPLRRVNQAVALLTIGTRESAFRNVKSVAECLADELITQQRALPTRMLSKVKKDELERVAKSNRDWIDQPEQARNGQCVTKMRLILRLATEQRRLQLEILSSKIQQRKSRVLHVFSQTAKPSLQGVRIKARKGAVKAQAKHERAVSVHTITLVLLALTPCPAAVFRDQVYKYLEPVQSGDFEGYTKELVAAGGTLEYLKYADALFEILIVGGLLQPGGNFLDDGAPKSPFSVANVPEPVQIDEVKKYVEVFNKLIRRYKYLQRPLEESSLQLDAIHASLASRAKRQSRDRNGSHDLPRSCVCELSSNTYQGQHRQGWCRPIHRHVRLPVILAEQTMDHLSSLLKKGGIKDLLLFFPVPKRTADALLTHFKEANLPQISDWYTKKQTSALKTQLIAQLKEMCENEEPPEAIITAIKEHQAALPETELVQVIWQGLMASVDWSARADQIEGLALREVTKYAPIIEPFCNTGKSQVALINVVQVYCYDDTRIIKAFPQILKVLYNKDCVSDQAIIYWFQKGAKPQGKQHFLKASEPLVKFLQSQQDESDEEDEE
ncbi:eIF4-gamma/eIF5/eIF2-epsilon [Rhizoctonia solani]|uniref:eIF4-gamma/eIF5/eIF2-epsilon n=1 Tax=Rhizoctonia solani TaxID=456999 RepID=A0A8H7M6P2_9AGAM|nr:eIF4-gamma/eIF5/eIF2-epsilon [Rhizoctonia solani]